MSEKYDPAEGPDARPDPEPISDEPSPFKLSSLVPGAEDRSAQKPPQRDPSPPAEPPAEIDAGVQELQARPADLRPQSYAEPPKTIISDRVPEWPTWSDGGLPPLIIYGPTPTQRRSGFADAPAVESTSANSGDAEPEAPEPAAPASSELPQQPSEPYASEDLLADAGSLEPPEPPPLDESIPSVDEPTESAAYETIAPEATADDTASLISASEAGIPTLPVDATVPAESAELDEIFDSIDEIAPEVSADRDLLPPQDQDIPATIMGEVPDLSDLQVDQYSDDATASVETAPASAEAADAPPTVDEPGWDAGLAYQPEQGAPVEPLFEASASEGASPELTDVEPLEDSPASIDADLPPDAEPELAVSENELVESGRAVPVEPVVTIDSEPTPLELAALPAEPVGALPVAAVAGGIAAAGIAARVAMPSGGAAVHHGYPHDASHGQTAAEFFAHAHEDVEQRRGVLSHGWLTKLSGLGGLLAGAVALSVLLLSCAGFGMITNENIPTGRWALFQTAIWVGPLAVFLAIGAIFWKSWWPSALLAAVVAILAGGGWYALGQYTDKVTGINLLSISPWITYVGLGGLALAVLGGLIEHRKMKEETHVLAAVFTNLIAIGAGGLLWMLWLGMSLLIKSGGNV